MKILHTESARGWAGQGIRVINEARGMRDIGHDVWICCDPNSDLASRWGKISASIYRLPMRSKSLIAAIRLRHWLKAQKFDVINAHSSTDHWIAAVAIMGLANRPLLVRTRHISSPLNNNMLTRWLYRSGTDYLITAGEKLKKDLVEYHHLPANKISSIPTGNDPNHFFPAPNPLQAKKKLMLPTDRVIIGIVAKMRPWKGHKDLLIALHESGIGRLVSVLFVGNGRLMEELKKLSHRFGIDCYFAGQVENVTPYMQAMDLHCLPSRGVEGVPQAITQAMLCGLPVISADVGSVSEFINHGENGFLYPAGNISELSNALNELVASKVLRQRMGQRSLQFARQKATIQTMINKTDHVMTTICSELPRNDESP